MKRILVAVTAGVLVFAASLGLAASLNLTTQSLGATTQTVAACQAGTLTASYATTYSATVPGYTVGTVNVGGLASTCYNMSYKITLAGAGGTSLGEVVGLTPGTGTTFAATFTSPVNAASVTGISVVITG